ncbi:DUF6634 family protein [Methylobacterium sp. SI9]|uniref:DUF6634 family protein n=1 Tax=Methylobacterium guangdongense TaxID=3138811 RepID=UPI00313BE2DB
MSILHRGPGPFPGLTNIAAKLRRLSDDLERIAQGRHPNAADLLNAPVLMNWQVYLVPVPCLTGIVLGHPRIADGHVCHTSQLFTYDPELGYARTFSRFYRLLGRDAGSGD